MNQPNILSTYLSKRLTSAGLAAIACGFVISTGSVQAQLFDGPVDRLPAIERDSLRKGQVVITGEKGQYTSRVLVTATPDRVWEVLTDCANMPKFMPNLVSCKVLETKSANQRIVEQIDSRQVFFTTVRSRTTLDITETPKHTIDFRMIEGDLVKLNGTWKIEPVAAYRGAASTQVLISEVIEVQPNESVPADIFYNIFKSSLEQNLKAISQEVKQRSVSSK